MEAEAGRLSRGKVAGAALLLATAGALAGAGFRYWSALPGVPALDASTIAGLAAISLGIVLLIQLQRSRADLDAIDPWAILAVAALAGVLAGLIGGPLPDNARAFRGTVHLELTSPIEAKFDGADTVSCETVPGTERIAWLSATSMDPVETPATETPEPDPPTPNASESPAPEASESPDPELPALSLYLAIEGGPVGIAISESPTNEPMTGVGTSLQIIVRDRSGRATFSGLFTEEAWIGQPGGGYLAGSVRWSCSHRLPDEVNLPGG